MRIAERLRNGPPCFSFEFFPPKSEEGVTQLFTTLKELADLSPGFVSVTYGAGGSTRQLTIELTSAIKRETGIEAMAHLTCVGHGRVEIAEILERLKSAGVENVLALRGDPPQGEVNFTAAPDGFSHGNELMQFVRARGYTFCLGGACYPEAHLEAEGLDAEIEHTKRKVADGAEFLITQLFFDPDDYFRFVDRARAIGIDVPIIPGIMPVTNVAQIHRFTSMCGASIPAPLRDLLDGVKDDEAAVVAVGIEWASDQARRLLAGGAPGVHFYTLNRSHSSQTVVQNLTGKSD